MDWRVKAACTVTFVISYLDVLYLSDIGIKLSKITNQKIVLNIDDVVKTNGNLKRFRHVYKSSCIYTDSCSTLNS